MRKFKDRRDYEAWAAGSFIDRHPALGWTLLIGIGLALLAFSVPVIMMALRNTR